MNKIILALLAGSIASLPLHAADSYTIDSRHTFPSFEISHLGFSIQRGRFNRTNGKVIFDTKKRTGSIQIIIDTASISTGLEELEEHLRKEDFFDAVRYPKITFNADTLHFKNEQLVAAEGFLNMHGVTKPVKLSIDHFHCGLNIITMKNTCGANATTTIKRSDFGVDKYAPALADEVKIIIQVEATKD